MKSSKKINPIIKTLILEDGFMWAGFYFNSAVAAVYLSQIIDVDPVKVIATGYAIYLLSRSVPELLVAKFLDEKRGFLDEVYTAVIGGVLIGVVNISYIWISSPTHLYILSMLSGLGTTLYILSWRKLFASFLDKGIEAKENALFDIAGTTIGAIITIFGGMAVDFFGSFKPIFIITGCISIVAAMGVYSLSRAKKINGG